MPRGPEIAREPLRRVVTIQNPQGLHMRPAAAFAEQASRFEGSVTVSRDGRLVDGKNWLDLLLLAAEPGAKLTLEVAGADAPAALESLAELLASIPPDDDADAVRPKG